MARRNCPTSELQGPDEVGGVAAAAAEGLLGFRGLPQGNRGLASTGRLRPGFARCFTAYEEAR